MPEHRIYPVEKGGMFPPIMPDESGTNDRLKPVFRRFRKLYINQRYPRNLPEPKSP
jgi:hypothetical protein